jgi:hypothetical protein
MSQIVDSQVGRFRRVLRDGADLWLWECPRCTTWGQLDEDQMAGRVSVLHECGYHETHDFGNSLLAAMRAHILMGQPPAHEDEP